MNMKHRKSPISDEAVNAARSLMRGYSLVEPLFRILEQCVALELDDRMWEQDLNRDRLPLMQLGFLGWHVLPSNFANGGRATLYVTPLGHAVFHAHRAIYELDG